MALSTDAISNELSSLVNRLDFNKLPAAQVEAQFSQLSSQVSQLGTQVGQTTGGFMSLTQELDIPTEVLNDTLSQMQAAAADFSGGQTFGLQEELENIGGVVNRGIVMLAENPPGLQIQNAVSSANAALESLTEGTVGGGFNNINITANTPEAMAKVMSAVAQVPIEQAQAALGDIIPQVPAFQEKISGVLGNLQNNLPVINSLSSQVSAFGDNVKNALGQVASAKGFLNDLVEDLTGSIAGDIRGILDINSNIPDELLSQATELLKGGSAERAASLLQGFADVPVEQLIESLSSVSTSLSRDVQSKTAPNNAPVAGVSPTQAPANPNQAVTNSGVLYGLLNAIDREISEVVFRPVDIFSGEARLDPTTYPNYHFVLQPNGTINRPAALNEQLDIPGHEQYSIGVIIVTQRGEMSTEQTNILDTFLRGYFSLYPQGQIIDYNDIVLADPGLSIVEYAKNHFDYRQVATNPAQAASPQEITDTVRRMSEGVVTSELETEADDAYQAVAEEIASSAYPFIHPEDRARSIWTFDYGFNSAFSQTEKLQPFGEPEREGQAVLYRINEYGGRIKVAVAIHPERRNGPDTSVLDWFSYSLAEFEALGATVSAETKALDNIVRRPV